MDLIIPNKDQFWTTPLALPGAIESLPLLTGWQALSWPVFEFLPNDAAEDFSEFIVGQLCAELDACWDAR